MVLQEHFLSLDLCMTYATILKSYHHGCCTFGEIDRGVGGGGGCVVVCV